MKVLIAEDDLMNQLLMAKYMRTLGWEHTIVANGKLAVEACISTDFDAILMDIEMPELDGIQATRNIRLFNLVIPIIAVTAYANEKNKEECTKAGMNAFLSKPVKAEVIKDIITGFIAPDLLVSD
jgi:CheY-like chemotaxis protein